MRKLIIISLSLAMAVALSGCGGQELADVGLVTALGLDGGREVTVTAAVDGEEEVYTARGGDVVRAVERLRSVGDRRLEVTHVEEVLLGGSVDPADTLWQQVVHRKSGYGAGVWLVAEGTAEELLSRCPNAAQRLKHLTEDGGVGSPTLLEALSDLARTGRTRLPVVAVVDGQVEVVERREVTGRVDAEGGLK